MLILNTNLCSTVQFNREPESVFFFCFSLYGFIFHYAIASDKFILFFFFVSNNLINNENFRLSFPIALFWHILYNEKSR